MRTVIVGASSGLGRCIGVGLAGGGDPVALLARRRERLDNAVEEANEAGGEATAIACDVCDEASIEAAIAEAATALGGIDAVVYTPGIGPLARIEDTGAALWRQVFDTNVIGASLVTAAALPHLSESAGIAMYLSSVSGTITAPWPGLGAYATSKAALEKLIEAWRGEHPGVAFTRLTVGECGGGEDESRTGFNEGWDRDLAGELAPLWFRRQYLTGALMDVGHLVGVVAAVLRAGASLSVPTLAVTPRPPATGPS